MNSSLRKRLHQLAFRTDGVVDVTLEWDAETDQCSVCVSDKEGRLQLLLAAAHHEVMRVFMHPYPYAAARGISYDMSVPTSAQRAAA